MCCFYSCLMTLRLVLHCTPFSDSVVSIFFGQLLMVFHSFRFFSAVIWLMIFFPGGLNWFSVQFFKLKSVYALLCTHRNGYSISHTYILTHVHNPIKYFTNSRWVQLHYGSLRLFILYAAKTNTKKSLNEKYKHIYLRVNEKERREWIKLNQ